MVNKFTKKLIYHRLINNLIIVFFIFIGIFFEFSNSENEEFIFDKTLLFISIGISLFIYLCLIIYNILYYKTSSYSLSEDGIKCSRGVLFKKESFINYKNIHSINKRQGLLQQMFGIGSLLIDSGSTNTAYTAEITIIEDIKTIDYLIEKIQSYSSIDNKKTNKNLYNFYSKNKFAYSLLSTLSFFLIASVVFVATFLALYFTYDFIKESDLTLTDVLLKIVYTYISISLFALLCNILFTFINYHKFELYKNNDEIVINYGSIFKNTNTFKLDKINAVIVKTGLIKRIFSLASIDIEVIGYGDTDRDSKKKNSVLIPLCNKNDVNKYISLIFDEFTPIENKVKSKSFFSFVSWKLIFSLIPYAAITTIVLFICNIVNDYLALIIITSILTGIFIVHMLVLFINAIMQYKYEGIAINDEKISIYHGGFIQRQTTVLKRSIIAIEDVTTPLRAKKNIYSFVVHFKTNSSSNKVMVENVDIEVKEKLMNLLKF